MRKILKDCFRRNTWNYKLISFCSSIMLVGSFLPHVALAQTTTATPSSIQPYLDRVVEQVTEYELDNGMKFILLKRDKAPIVSFVTYADVGGANEPDGKTGVAHFLEHLAFKGTRRIGTTNYEAEKPLLERLDELFEEIQATKAEGDEEKLAQLQAEFAEVEVEAAQYAKQNEFGQIVETSGGEGLNAATSADYTIYFYSLPANKTELWMALESERFLDPVFREFYKEKEVILEERRLRTDNSPVGKMIEEFLDTAYEVHPYKRPVIGYDEDIRNLERSDVEEFFTTHYAPNNLTVAIVGDIDPQEVKELSEVYFGRYPAKPQPPEVTRVEPAQRQTKEVTLELNSQPWYLEGYHRPSINHPDHAVYEIISRLLSDGRTSRLYKSLVEEKQVALTAQGFSGFPGDKYPNLMLFYALTAPNSSVEDVANALDIEIELLKTELVSSQELDRVKTQARAELLRSLGSNIGMGQLLVKYEVLTGDWRNLFKQLEAIAQVDAADVKRVSQKTFTPENRTIGRLLPKGE